MCGCGYVCVCNGAQSGSIYVSGVEEVEVFSLQDMLACLQQVRPATSGCAQPLLQPVWRHWKLARYTPIRGPGSWAWVGAVKTHYHLLPCVQEDSRL